MFTKEPIDKNLTHRRDETSGHAATSLWSRWQAMVSIFATEQLAFFILMNKTGQVYEHLAPQITATEWSPVSSPLYQQGVDAPNPLLQDMRRIHSNVYFSLSA